MDTIAAIATAAGRGGIGVIRVSGPSSLEIAKKLTQKKLPIARQAVYREFYECLPEQQINKNQPTSVIIDSGVLIFFQAPHSFTGEDIIEIQIHGSPVTLSTLLQSCITAGARLANAGEFSQRAFLNGKIDLAQAEAIADLIESSSKAVMLGAGNSLRGEFSQKINSLSEQIIKIRALVEAGLDFADEDIEFIDRSQLQEKVKSTLGTLKVLSRQTNNGVILREGINVVIAGAPNVGKSSLLNSLIGEEIAIVTEHPGTTRDTISQTILISGIPFHIIDTAGIRETQNPVERIGINRTLQAIAKADLILHIKCLKNNGELITDDKQTQKIIAESIANKAKSQQIIEIINKIDLQISENNYQFDKSVILISAKNKIGLDELKEKIIAKTGFVIDVENEQNIFIARTRHLIAINECVEHLQKAQMIISNRNNPDEIIAEELRLSHLALQKITGKFLPDDLLGEIFGKFCIGK